MKSVYLAILLVFGLNHALADEVSDAIAEGSDAYKRGELGTAASQWEYAAQLVRQAKAEKVIKLLPAALMGWDGSQDADSSSSAAILGGGINVSKAYSKGEEEIRIEVTMDSALLQSTLAMISNPQLIAMSGQKVKKIKGHTAAIESEEGNTKLQIVVGNNILIVVEGSPAKAAMDYAEAINFDAISALK